MPRRSWRPGEHVAVVGQTGSGKTHLVDRLVRANRQFVVVFKTKHDPEDDTEYWRGFRRAERARDIENTRFTRFLLAPPLGKYGRQYAAQVREFHDLVDRVWSQGNWTVVFDEQWYIEQVLGGRDGVEMLVTQGRGKGISVVMGAQRPANISRFVLSQATHVFMFRGDNRDAVTLGEATAKDVRAHIEHLTEHDFAYWHQRTRSIVLGNARALGHLIGPPQPSGAPAGDNQGARQRGGT